MAFTARRGRPPKFTRPARSINVTLPVDVIASLTRRDADVGRAIVRLAMQAGERGKRPAVEVAAFGSRAVIVAPPSRALDRLAGVELVPLADGRALIALDDDVSPQQLELGVRDALDDGPMDAMDREVLEQVLRVLRDARRSGSLMLRRIIVLRAARARAAHRGRKERQHSR
jgi:hypothetical protein